MVIYNVTVKVETQIASEWLQWIMEEHIPDVMQTNCFFDNKVLRLLEVDDTEGPTYAIQFYAKSIVDYNRYLEIHATKMREKTREKWGEQLITFRSVMEVVK